MLQTVDYTPFIRELEQKYCDLVRESKKLRNTITYLKGQIAPAPMPTTEVNSEGSYAFLALTPAIRKCMEDANEPLTTTDIMNTILAGGLKTTSTNSQHFLSNISTTLNRMTDAIRIDGKWILDKFLPNKDLREKDTGNVFVQPQVRTRSH